MLRQGHWTDWGDGVRSAAYLLTGTSKNCGSLIQKTGGEFFERRMRTYRVRLFLMPDESVEQCDSSLVEHAKPLNVTVQQLCDDNGSETYPVLHLAKHGQRWAPKQSDNANN